MAVTLMSTLDISCCDRQPGETEKAFEAFKVYLNMEAGARSLREVGRLRGKARAQIEHWSSRYKWVERVRIWDNWNDQQARAERAKDIAAHRSRAAEQTRAQAQMTMLPAVAISRRIAAGVRVEEELAKLPLDRLIRLAAYTARVLPALLKAEALALGDATERNEVSGREGGPIETMDLSALSDGELEALAALLAKAEKKPNAALEEILRERDDALAAEIRHNPEARSLIARALELAGKGDERTDMEE